MNKRKAFTLVEMMAVVVIIGILAAVIAPRIFGQVGKAEQVTAKQDVEIIVNAVTMFRLDTQKFPQDLRDLVNEPDEVKNWRGPYLRKKGLKDPWDNDYQYRAPGNDGRDFDVWSMGKDGQEGGEGMNLDIISWDDDDV